MASSNLTAYSDDSWERLCDAIAAGNSLLAITRDQGMPSHRTVYRWLMDWSKSDDPELSARWHKYAHARAIQADRLAEQALEISDAASRLTDAHQVQAARLRVDTRKWYASKLAPKVYGVPQVQAAVNIDARTQQVIADPETLRALLGREAQKRLADGLDAEDAS